MTTYNFPRKQRQSYALVEKVRQWLARREDIAEVSDLQDDPRFYYRGDLVVTRRDGTVQYVEVKSEPRYTRDSTPYFAVERYSNVEKHTPGGPWSTSADFYAHVYPDGLLLIMSRRKLVQWIESALTRDPEAFDFRHIRNEGWLTGTYLIPRTRAKAALGIFYREYEVT
ncbi:MAG: hypothetical protein SF162_13140 [bacterium]|nr:hypothetical protein [bacterium]